MKIENIKISMAMYLLLVFVAIVMVVNALLGISSLGKINQGTKAMFFDRVIPLQQLKTASDKLAIDIVNTTYEMNHNTMEWDEGRKIVEASLIEIQESWNNYLISDIRGEELVLKNEAEALRKNAIAAVESLLKIATVKNETTSIEFNQFIENQLYANIDPFIAQLKKLMNIQLEIAQQVYYNSDSIYTSAFRNLVLVSAIAIIFIIVASLFLILTIGKSMTYANSIIKKITEGDLTINIDMHRKDEIGILLGNIGRMAAKLRDIVSFISSSSSNVAMASGELNAAARQIAQGTSQQASAIQEISASVEEMSANIQQNLQNAQKTESISVKAAREISQVVQSSEISLEKIREIAQKITIISSISFQTHILALNAAIEAARAGAQGKGFGVVAAEVGKLAERSKISATEIDKLAETSVSATENSGMLLQKIVPDIVSTSKFIQEITAANQEQSIGAEQINDGIQQLNQVTQQNAASSEELSSHAEMLAHQAEELVEMMAFFKVGKTAENNRLARYSQ